MHLIEEINRHKIRFLKTVFTCLCYICIGLQSSVIGVGLLDLKVLAGCDFNQISLTVTGRAIGYASGSVVAGLLESRINTQLLLMLCLFLGSAVHIAIPFGRTLLLICILCGVSGFACGIIDCFANIFILKLWAKECPPFLQALHFSYGLGSLGISFLVEPFLKEDRAEDIFDMPTNITKVVLKPEDIMLIVPYCIIAAITAAVGILFLFTYIFARETSDHPSRNERNIETSKDGKQVEIIRIVIPNMRILIIILTSFFLLFYVGLEKTIGTFIQSFAHDGPLRLPKKSGALITAVYWIAFTTFRLCAIFLSSIFGCLTVLIINLIVTICATIVLCAIQTSEPAFWIGCIFIGIGLSSTWGSMFGFIESEMFPLNGKIVSIFSVGANIGASVVPALIGWLMGQYTNEIFAWFSVASSFLIAIMFFIIFILGKTVLSRTVRRSFKSQLSQISQPKY